MINKSERRQSEPQTKRRAAQRRKLDEAHPRLVVNLQAAATRKHKKDGGHVLRQSRHSLLVGAHAKLRERAINCAARGITMLQKARRFREPHILALEDRRVARDAARSHKTVSTSALGDAIILRGHAFAGVVATSSGVRVRQQK